jgi:phage tail-like protein
MSCGPARPTWRLLDGFVGWDAMSIEALTGNVDASGVRLIPHGAGSGMPEAEVWPFIPPPRLAYDCRSCTWFLVTPWPPASRGLQLGPCDTYDARWRPFAAEGDFKDLVAVAAHSDLVAAADHTRGLVHVWSRSGARVGVISVPAPTALASASPCEILVVSARRRILRFDPAGQPLGEIPTVLPAGVEIRAIAVAGDGSLWVVVAEGDGRVALYRRGCDCQWTGASLAELRDALPNTGLTVVTPNVFCLRRRPRSRNSERCCYNWFGRPADAPTAATSTDVFARQGQLLTEPIDSGRPRCRWHRVRVDADVPAGSGLEVAIATAEVIERAAPQGQPDPGWPGFVTGTPHPLDWQVVPGSRDFLIGQPPGRYLYVRLRLTGDGTMTPVVRSIRLDFPRATGVDALPLVYREDPRGEDFSERFVALFDAALEDLDRAVERFPALLDIADTPEDVLPWIGRFLGAVFDPAWDTARRRRLLAALPALYARRGTPRGLAEAVKLVFDVDAAIEETTGVDLFGAVAAAKRRTALDARLGSVRLFGRARVRFRLGASALSRTPMRIYGSPAVDPLAIGAFRFHLSVPALGASPDVSSRLRRLVDSQKPAHTIATIIVGSRLLVLGRPVRVGIDTRLGAPPPPVLGASGNVRLNSDAILRGRPRTSSVVGHLSVNAC